MPVELTIITPIGKESIKVEWVQAESSYGSITIYPGHAPLVCSLKKHSEISYSTDGHMQRKTVTEGFIDIDRHQVTLILEAV